MPCHPNLAGPEGYLASLFELVASAAPDEGGSEIELKDLHNDDD